MIPGAGGSVPGIRPYQPSGGADDIDDAIAWVSVIALFDDMTVAQQAEFLYRVALWSCDLRSLRIEHLEFHQETVRRAMALPFARPEP